MQIIPANGAWHTLYSNDEDGVDRASRPVAVWCLVEYCDGTRSVEGWTPASDEVFGIGTDASADNFEGYDYGNPVSGDATSRGTHD